ncbi:hypothetical protein [Streptomyces sp. NPDC001404]|uniref:hypothetical protein n=1 Tax=Streptomyces sp. NPDC001404 TaxID=3364571 RepID=UPI0036D064BB
MTAARANRPADGAPARFTSRQLAAAKAARAYVATVAWQCGADPAVVQENAFAEAIKWLSLLIGGHISLAVRDGLLEITVTAVDPRIMASAEIVVGPGGWEVQEHTDTVVVLAEIVAAGLVAGGPGSIITRHRITDGRQTARGWRLTPDGPVPLPSGEVFDAHCTDVLTGEPIPPEPGVAYEAGFVVVLRED